jgi:hypothetical protein
LIPEEQWQIYRRGIEAIRNSGVRFMLGGGFAMARYTKRWRNTKDIDFYVMPEDRDMAAEALRQAGFEDYFYRLPYDRGWIYRSYMDGVIVDVIWAMANRRAFVDNIWFERATGAVIRGETFSVLPLEELAWAKMYVLQHDHSDWPDVLNLLYTRAEEMDWEHLMWRMEGDHRLLKAMLTLFNWVCPGRCEGIPKSVRRALKLSLLAEGRPEDDVEHPRLLDSRKWFAGLVGEEEMLEI